jgi:hypothetical protein
LGTINRRRKQRRRGRINLRPNTIIWKQARKIKARAAPLDPVTIRPHKRIRAVPPIHHHRQSFFAFTLTKKRKAMLSPTSMKFAA